MKCRFLMTSKSEFTVEAVINGEIDACDNCYLGYTALSIASEFGRPDLIKILLRRGADVNFQDEHGNNALIIATLYGNFKSVETLVKYGDNINLNLQNSHGSTALSLSIFHGFNEITYFLIENGADINIRDNEGSTPLIFASSSGNTAVAKKLIQKWADPNLVNNSKDSALMYAIKGGHIEIVKELLSNGIDCNLSNSRKETALILASKLRKLNALKMLLNYPCLDVNIEDDSKFNALMYASYNGDYEIVEALLKYGADVNHRNSFDLFPLKCAAYGHHFEIYDLLIKHGAEEAITFSDAQPMGVEKLLFIILMNLSFSSSTFSKYIRISEHLLILINAFEKDTPLLALSEFQKIDLQYLYPILCDREYNAFSFLLLRLGIDVNFVYSHGMTPLMIAAKKSNELLVEKLLKLGANLNMVNDDGDSVLDIACKNGYLEIVKILCRHGASINHPILDQDSKKSMFKKPKSVLMKSKSLFKDFKSPLLISINYGHIKLTEWIFKHLEDVNQTTEMGVTALMYSAACRGKYSQALLSLCLEFKVDVNIADSMGRTALMQAAQCNNIEFVKSLLLAHADVDLKSKDGKNAFTFAIQNNHKEMFSLMIEYTIDINQRVVENKTLLIYSVLYGCLELTKEILRRGGEVDYCDDFGNTPLIFAAQLDNLEMVLLLLKSGARVNNQNKLGCTALMEAVMNRNIFIVNALLHAQADLDLQDTDGNTALDLTTHSKFKSFMCDYCSLIVTNDYLYELSNEISPPKVQNAQSDYFGVRKNISEPDADKKCLSFINNCLDSITNPTSPNRNIKIDHKYIDKLQDEIIMSLLGKDSILKNSFRQTESKIEPILLNIITAISCHDSSKAISILDNMSRDALDENMIKKLIIHIVKYQNQTVLNKLIDLGLDLNSPGNVCSLVLSMCIINQEKEGAAFLLLNGVYFNIDDLETRHSFNQIDDKDFKEITVFVFKLVASDNRRRDQIDKMMMWAIKHYKNEIVLYLLQNGANVNFRDTSGNTPLTCASLEKNIQIVKYLIEYGADVNLPKSSKNAPLYIVAGNGYIDIAETLINTSLCDVNSKNIDDNTPLMFAADQGHVDIVSILLDHGADVNIQSIYGCTALMWAVQSNSSDIISLLLNRKPNFDLFDVNGHSVIIWSILYSSLEILKLLLSAGATFKTTFTRMLPLNRINPINKKSVMIKYLVSNTILSDPEYSQIPILVLPVLLNKAEFIPSILNSSINIDELDAFENTTLTWAASLGNTEMVSLLLEHGANINQKGQYGQTPLMKASMNRNISVAKLLVDMGADTTITDSNGLMAIDMTSDTDIHRILMKSCLGLYSDDLVKR